LAETLSFKLFSNISWISEMVTQYNTSRQTLMHCVAEKESKSMSFGRVYRFTVFLGLSSRKQLRPL
jgi:hypothetical protein